MKKIIYTRQDGGVSILYPAQKEIVGKIIPSVLNMTDDEYLEFIKNKDVPEDAINTKIVDESYVPTDRTNRNEWVDKGDKIEPDENKVQEKENNIAREESEQLNVLSKLGITKEDAEILLAKGRVK